MRFIITTLLLLPLLASPLAAQALATPAAAGVERPAEPQPATIEAPFSSPAASWAAFEPRLQRIDSADASAGAVLDEGFWRQVAAGVLVTVISTLILRAIL